MTTSISKRVAQMRSDGQTIVEVAANLGLSKYHVQRLARAGGRPAGERNGKYPSLLKLVRDLKDGGASNQEVLSELGAQGYNRETILGYLQSEYGVNNDEATMIAAARVACDAHLNDLQREHGRRA